jgi:hypothetical protein
LVAIETMAAAAMNIIESRKYGNGVMYGRWVLGSSLETFEQINAVK